MLGLFIPIMIAGTILILLVGNWLISGQWR